MNVSPDYMAAKDVLCDQYRARICELEAENAALRHDLEKSMANHVADLNSIPHKGLES
jgi:hypothetical protein